MFLFGNTIGVPSTYPGFGTFGSVKGETLIIGGKLLGISCDPYFIIFLPLYSAFYVDFLELFKLLSN